MKAIILAGGLGTRLYPVTLEIPKPLLPVKRKPILNYLVELFGAHGIREIKVVIRPQDRAEFDWWLKRWGKELAKTTISFEEEAKPMGTLGYWAHHLQNWTKDEPFFLTNGDELKAVNLTEMREVHEKNGGHATIALVKVPNPREYGVALLEGNHIAQFLEKPENPPSNLISSGLYIVDPKSVKYLEPHLKNKEEFLMIEKHLFPILAEKRELTAYPTESKWFDCGNLERWEKAIKEW